MQNSFCPCGSGKKIKFCCNDRLTELKKLDRMLEGEQYIACLQHIERLMEADANRDRACMLAMKCKALQHANREDELAKTAAAFLEKHPNNQIALAEAGLDDYSARPACGVRFAEAGIASGGRQSGAGDVSDGRRVGNGAAQHRAASAGWRIGVFAYARWRPTIGARGSWPKSSPRRKRRRCCLREDWTIATPPEGAPWKGRFDEAMTTCHQGDWLTAIELFEALAADAPDSPAVWRNLATLYGWTGRQSKVRRGPAALRRAPSRRR